MYEYQSEDVTTLAKALLAVQKSLQPALKDAENPFTRSHYATLNSVMEACRDALQDNGIWMTQLPMPTPEHMGAGHLGLLTKFTHATSGQWQASLTIVPLPKNDPQGMGSAMTYARRYALTAMLGIVTEDDDGQGAMPATKSTNRKRQTQGTKANPDKGHGASTGSKQPSHLENIEQAEHPALKTMPKLDGVEYSTTTTKDGKICIIATGNTTNKKQILSQAGFTWNVQRRLWWRYINAA